MTRQTALVTTPQELLALDDAWKALRGALARPTMEHQRGWLESEARTGEGMMVLTLGPKEDTRAIAPFLLKKWKLQCRIGYRSIASFPMLLARLCGDTFLAPEDPAIQQELFEAVAKASVPYHTLFIEGLGVDAPLRKLIDSSPVVKKHFDVYCPTPPVKHWLLRLPKTFAEYDASLGKKRRGQFKASERKLSAACGSPVKIQRITSPEQLPEFFDAVAKISKLSWQGRKLGQTIQAGDPAAIRMTDFAREGWFRGYLLRSEEHVIAFVIGFQSDGIYDYMKIGYDPKWSEFSPGNVMLYRLIEDVCTHDPAAVIDFGGGDSQYKQVFGNDSFEEQNVYLMRKTPYTRLARVTHKATVDATSAVREGLRRTGLIEKVRRVLRGAKDKPGDAPKKEEATPATKDADGANAPERTTTTGPKPQEARPERKRAREKPASVD